jgi:putative oxidoreductase
MAGAILAAKMTKGFVGGFELELLLMFISTSLLISGPGRISIERDVLKREIFPKTKYHHNKERKPETTFDWIYMIFKNIFYFILKII